MNGRRPSAALALAALPLALVATPALAGPPLAQAQPVTERPFDSTLRRLDTDKNRIKLTDGTVIRYDSNDIVNVLHSYDLAPSDTSPFDCDVFDSGGEELAEAFVDAGYELRVNGTIVLPRSEVSAIFFTADTCDGVVDERDVSPRLP